MGAAAAAGLGAQGRRRLPVQYMLCIPHIKRLLPIGCVFLMPGRKNHLLLACFNHLKTSPVITGL